jgi:hypothetical protein
MLDGASAAQVPRCVRGDGSAETALGRGYEALASGDWEGARAAFHEALDATDSAEALDGLVAGAQH